jgi:hypothetical protein
MAKLECALSFHAPPEIHSRGYPTGFIDAHKLVCCDDTGLFVFDLATGAQLRHVPIANASSLYPVTDGYVVSKRTIEGGQLVHVTFDDSATTTVEHPGHIKSWSGSEVAIFADGTLTVRRWPTMELVHAAAGYHPTVDWADRLLLVSDEDNHRHVIDSIDTKERRFVPYLDLSTQPFYVLGNGVADVNFGFELVSYRAGWRTKLGDVPSDASLSLRLTRDGRGLRAVIGNRPFRFDLDFETGALLTELPDLTRSQEVLSTQLWNPTRDDLIVLEDNTSAALCDHDGNILTRLPPTGEAKQWFDDGLALLVTHPTDDSPLRIDVWRLID